MDISNICKYVLTLIGSRSTEHTIHVVNAVANYLEVGRWMRARGFEIPGRLERREAIFDCIAAEVSASRVLYLEFGVHRGASMTSWSKLLRSAESRLHGFDSFEGLPEKWNVTSKKGSISTGGAVPSLDDPRVTFFKGLVRRGPPPLLPARSRPIGRQPGCRHLFVYGIRSQLPQVVDARWDFSVLR